MLSDVVLSLSVVKADVKLKKKTKKKSGTNLEGTSVKWTVAAGGGGHGAFSPPIFSFFYPSFPPK